MDGDLIGDKYDIFGRKESITPSIKTTGKYLAIFY
jgi:hypothetical protein